MPDAMGNGLRPARRRLGVQGRSIRITWGCAVQVKTNGRTLPKVGDQQWVFRPA